MKHIMTLRALAFLTATRAGVPIDVFFGDGRPPSAIAARRAYVTLARDLPARFFGGAEPSYPEIAKAVDRTNHSSMIEQYREAKENHEAQVIVQAVCRELGATYPLSPRLKQYEVGGAVQQRMDAIERKATELLAIVCESMGIEVQEVRSKSVDILPTLARRVFVSIARDTAYCGGQPSFPQLARVLCRHGSHSTAMLTRKHAKRCVATRREVARICVKLGVVPPAYAVEKAQVEA